MAFYGLHLIALCTLCLAPASAFNLVRKEHGSLCSYAEDEPLLSCKKASSTLQTADHPENLKLQEAYEKICQDGNNEQYMEVFLDRRFRDNYAKIYKDGWADYAWVNYVAVKKKGGVYGGLTERLVDSLHRFSNKPAVVVNFGAIEPDDLDPKKFPNLVLLHARDFSPDLHVSFNFNKFRAVLLSRVKVGASLDSDMVLLNKHGDQLLNRTAEEINEKYPFPMMPTHFLNRDPRDEKSGKGNYLKYECENCPLPTMRWGQAQPTWTFWSLPFLSRWLSAKMAGRAEQGVKTQHISEDEDLLNVALWKEGATKEWCAFQTGGVQFPWENLYAQHPPGPTPWYEDTRYYPAGVPVAFFFGHAEKDLKRVDEALNWMAKPERANATTPKTFFHNSSFFETFDELKKAYPDLKCTL